MASIIRVFTGNRLPKIMATPAVTTTLLGPPEIYKRNPITIPSASSAAPITNQTNFNQFPPPTWPTFRSTGNPCLDFFFHVVPKISHRKLKQLLQISWDHDPLKTLKLICNLRGVRRLDKESYYSAVLWLHDHHPKTLAYNVASLAHFGYLKDLPEILFRLLQGSRARKLAKDKCRNKFKAFRRRIRYEFDFGSLEKSSAKSNREEKKIELVKKVTSKSQVISSAKFLKLTREEKKIERAKKVIVRFNSDPNFKILHDRVSGLFADCLRSDMKELMIGNGDCNINISLAAKWCPSLDSSYDQYTLLCEAIAKKVFPKEEYEEYAGIEEGHYVYRVRDRLRKQVLVPLRKALELPEVYIGANDWGSIPYNRVSTVAMRLYKEKFMRHDGERFKEYRRKVEEENKAKIKELLPHEIIASLDDEDGCQVAELQWKRMVDDMLKKGKLSNCIAICDFQTGGLHEWYSQDVLFALGILLSELSAEPWKGKLIPFSETLALRRVEGETLKEKTMSLKQMEVKLPRYDCTPIDFSKVYDLILDVAVHGGLKPDEMVKRIFVLTVDSFDQASSERCIEYNPRSWEEIYEASVRKYRESGYGDSVPEMVFWNLNESKATIVPTKILHGNFPGVSLVNGISKNLVKFFLEGGDMNHEAFMDAAISGEDYEKLVVLD